MKEKNIKVIEKYIKKMGYENSPFEHKPEQQDDSQVYYNIEFNKATWEVILLQESVITNRMAKYQDIWSKNADLYN